jgi:hypothetical protein
MSFASSTMLAMLVTKKLNFSVEGDAPPLPALPPPPALPPTPPPPEPLPAPAPPPAAMPALPDAALQPTPLAPELPAPAPAFALAPAAPALLLPALPATDPPLPAMLGSVGLLPSLQAASNETTRVEENTVTARIFSMGCFVRRRGYDPAGDLETLRARHEIVAMTRCGSRRVKAISARTPRLFCRAHHDLEGAGRVY